MAVDLDPAEIESLFTQQGAAQAFAAIEAKCGAAVANSDSLLLRRAVIDHLAQRFERAAPDHEMMTALFAASPAYLRAEQGVRPNDGASVKDLFCDLVRRVLAALSPSDRAALYEALFSKLADLSLACLVANAEATVDGNPAIAAELSSRLDPRVETLAARGDLWRQAVPAAVLWFWWRFAQDDRLYAFVRTSMRDKASLSVILDMVVEPDANGTDLIAVRRWSKIVDFSGLEKEALQLALSGTAREDRRRARRFLDAFGNGKSELFR
ncbi:MAG: hypothetical protein ACLP8A_07270 [Methylovirgula sp.]